MHALFPFNCALCRIVAFGCTICVLPPKSVGKMCKKTMTLHTYPLTIQKDRCFCVLIETHTHKKMCTHIRYDPSDFVGRRYVRALRGGILVGRSIRRALMLTSSSCRPHKNAMVSSSNCSTCVTRFLLNLTLARIRGGG